MKEFINVLFDAGDGICYGDFKANKVYSDVQCLDGEFFCINALSTEFDYGYESREYFDLNTPRRADVNVTKFRNFLFEIDCLPVDDQLRIFNNCGIEFTSLVYSGGKSVHAIISLEKPLDAVYHKDESKYEYRELWERLAAKIDLEARSLGYEYPKGKSSFIDSACKNPSRLSRSPDVLRDNGNIQTLISLKSRISLESLELLKLPKVYKSYNEGIRKSVLNFNTVEEFWKYAPVALKDDLIYAPWAASSGCYSELYRLTKFAIDYGGVSDNKELFIEILWMSAFDKLLQVGYPKCKLMTAINHAYDDHRRKNVGKKV